MAQVRWFCQVLMIPSLLGSCSAEAVAYNKSVCNGDSIQLFANIQINDSDTSATLHKNGDKYGVLARWTIAGHNFTENNNLFMDDKNNLWIMNVHPHDEGLYQLSYKMPNGINLKSKIQLSVWVAPKDNCNILVSEIGQILTVSLTGKDCGKPKASVYWKNYTGVTVHDENIIQLQSGKEAGTYFACMRGIALSCARSSDPSAVHCRPYNVKKGQSQSSTVGSTTQLSSDASTDPLLIVILVLQCVGLLPVILFGSFIVYKRNPCGCKGDVLHTHQRQEATSNVTTSGLNRPELPDLGARRTT